MRVALGWKAHSGWAALVVLGAPNGRTQVIDRRRVELVVAGEAAWAAQPYHAAEGSPAPVARRTVQRGVQSARRNAARAMRAAVRRTRQAGHDVVACAVLMGRAMPEWSVDEILAVHFRMHKAEGVLFREALARAAAASGLRLIEVPEHRLGQDAQQALGLPMSTLLRQVAMLGSSVGPPWGKDQKDAALAAMIALGRADDR